MLLPKHGRKGTVPNSSPSRLVWWSTRKDLLFERVRRDVGALVSRGAACGKECQCDEKKNGHDAPDDKHHFLTNLTRICPWNFHRPAQNPSKSIAFTPPRRRFKDAVF